MKILSQNLQKNQQMGHGEKFWKGRVPSPAQQSPYIMISPFLSTSFKCNDYLMVSLIKGYNRRTEIN